MARLAVDNAQARIPRLTMPAAGVGLGLITGGFMANLFEMVVLGGITDYIPFRDWRLSGGDVTAYDGGILLVGAALFRAVRLYRRSQ